MFVGTGIQKERTSNRVYGKEKCSPCDEKKFNAKARLILLGDCRQMHFDFILG